MVDPRIAKVMQAAEILNDLINSEEFASMDGRAKVAIVASYRMLGNVPAPEIDEHGNLV